MLHVTSGSNCFLVDAKGSELNFRSGKKLPFSYLEQSPRKTSGSIHNCVARISSHVCRFSDDFSSWNIAKK